MAASNTAEARQTASEQNAIGKKARVAPEMSEQQFRLLVQGVSDYAIFMLDPTQVVASWNLGAERIKGYRADARELRKRPLSKGAAHRGNRLRA